MLKNNYLILIFLIFFISSNENIDFSKSEQEFNSISYYFSDLFNNLQIDRESIVYLVYENKLLSENETNLQYLFYLDLGEDKKFYIGIEADNETGNLQVTDYVSSTKLSKVLNFLDVDVGDVFQNNDHVNYATNLLKSEIKPKFCNLENFEDLSQNPLIKKQQFMFDFNTLGISKNNRNYQTDENKPHQVFINLPDNLTAHSIEIIRTNIDKKNSSIEQRNKNILTNSEKNEIINLIQKKSPEKNINLDNFDKELESILEKVNKKNKIINSGDDEDDVLIKTGNIYNHQIVDSNENPNMNFPRFNIDSINFIKHPIMNVDVKDTKNKFPSEDEFESFKKSMEKYGTRLQELNKNVHGEKLKNEN